MGFDLGGIFSSAREAAGGLFESATEAVFGGSAPPPGTVGAGTVLAPPRRGAVGTIFDAATEGIRVLGRVTTDAANIVGPAVKTAREVQSIVDIIRQGTTLPTFPVAQPGGGIIFIQDPGARRPETAQGALGASNAARTIFDSRGAAAARSLLGPALGPGGITLPVVAIGVGLLLLVLLASRRN